MIRVSPTTLVLLLLFATSARSQEPTPIEAPEMIADEALAVPSDRFWGRVEYFLWTVKDDRTPGPLLTTGIVGQPGTRVLYDGSHLDYGLNSGGYLQLGYWLDAQRSLGLQVAGFSLETHTIHGEVNSDRTEGSPVVARPFFNVRTGKEDALIITTPKDGAGGRYIGGIDIFGDSRTWGGEANLVSQPFTQTPGTSAIGVLIGFRYLGQKDEFRFSQSSTVLKKGDLSFLGTPVAAPNIVSIRDYYETHNHFYGVQIGAFGDLRWYRWVLSLSGKLALGATDQDLRVSGHTLLTDDTGLTLNQPGGLYTQPSNIGPYRRYQFSVASELMLRLGYDITANLRTQVGYSFLYWGRVVRPGAQVNRNVDPRQLPAHPDYAPPAEPVQPLPVFQSTDFWAQGVSLGLEWRY